MNMRGFQPVPPCKWQDAGKPAPGMHETALECNGLPRECPALAAGGALACRSRAGECALTARIPEKFTFSGDSQGAAAGRGMDKYAWKFLLLWDGGNGDI